MFCAKCGGEIKNEGTRFCPGCGAPVGIQPVQTNQYQQPQYGQPQVPPYQAQPKGRYKTPLSYFTGAFKKYAVFQGRACRAEFWWFYLFSWIFILIAGSIGGTSLENRILYFIASFVFFLPSLAVWVRRINDTNKSGWFILVPIYNIILLFIAGTTGPNQYGDDPKGE